MSILHFVKGLCKKKSFNYNKMDNIYKSMPFPLRFYKLPYNLEDLEPYISKQTMYYHYNKHYKDYIERINSFIETNMKLQKKRSSLRLTDLLSPKIEKKYPEIYHNAVQIWNHTFYWNCLSPRKRPMSLNLRILIHDSFGSYDKFKDELFDKAINYFGVGWLWIVKNLKTNKLEIIDTEPLKYKNLIPILCLDLWEHAYYIDCKNNRDIYVEGWFEVIDWDFVEKNIRYV